jgi:hypothetical protein
MEELLSSGIILVACLCGGLSCVYIARSRTSINKHSRQRIKDYEADIKYLGEVKKSDAAEYRHEILRLKGTINKMKQGPDFTEKELIDGSGIGEILIKKFGLGKYLKYLPKGTIEKIEQGILDNKDTIIETLKQNNKSSKLGTETQTTETL